MILWINLTDLRSWRTIDKKLHFCQGYENVFHIWFDTNYVIINNCITPWNYRANMRLPTSFFLGALQSALLIFDAVFILAYAPVIHVSTDSVQSTLIVTRSDMPHHGIKHSSQQ